MSDGSVDPEGVGAGGEKRGSDASEAPDAETAATEEAPRRESEADPEPPPPPEPEKGKAEHYSKDAKLFWP